MGRQDPVCTAIQTLGTLEEKFEEQAQLVTDEEELGDPHGNARRAARYYLYRKWVYAAFGFLGKGKRIRIPPCVVEHIRNRFRERDVSANWAAPSTIAVTMVTRATSVAFRVRV